MSNSNADKDELDDEDPRPNEAILENIKEEDEPESSFD